MTRNDLLIVDDSPYLHKIVRTFLKPDAVVTHSVYDGESAVGQALALKPNLILLDVDMPVVDGFEVCRRLKASPATTQTPVIFLTADSDLCDKVKALELGAVDYITKPFKPDELRARVRTALRTSQDSEHSSMIDSLTTLWNRTYLDSQLPPQISLARRIGQPLSCVVADVDALSKLNDGHGTMMGDDVLRSIADIFLARARKEDLVCHCGAGQFVLLLPATSAQGAGELAERHRDEISHQLMHFNRATIGVTCSFGIADTQCASAELVLNRAENAVRRAKQSGGNMVTIAQSPPAGRINLC